MIGPKGKKVLQLALTLGSAIPWAIAEGVLLTPRSPLVTIGLILLGNVSSTMYFVGFTMFGLPNLGIIGPGWDIVLLLAAVLIAAQWSQITWQFGLYLGIALAATGVAGWSITQCYKSMGW
jgi:hypothetical protein